MEFAVIGLNHETAPIQIREKVAFIDSKKIEATNILLDEGIDEVVILSTCNRSEIYIVDYNNKIDAKIDYLISFYNNFFNVFNIEKYLYFIKNKDAIIHLYKVCSGLDSIVLGEDQILGQAKKAHEFSMNLGGSKKILNKLFREAIKTAKKIKNELKISERPLSISYIGVKFLKEKINGLSDKKVMLIGLGEIGRLILEYLIEENVKEIYMVNRNHNKVIDISKKYSQVKPINYCERYNVLDDIDILITATSSPHTIIKADKVKLNTKLTALDLAIPIDIDRRLKDNNNVTLYDIDDLKDISKENRKRREELSKTAIKIIEEEILEVLNWLKTIDVDYIIRYLNDKREKIKKDTFDFIVNKVELDDRDKKIISKMLDSALKRLIREPILKLKGTENNEIRKKYKEALVELYNIDVKNI